MAAVLVFLLLSPVFIMEGWGAPFIVKSFRAPEANIMFNHLAIDHSTGYIYIGATNRLHQLSSDFELLASATTGPQDDSPECSVTRECPSGTEKTSIDNVNKLLLLVEGKGQLIACGSLFQGSCEVRSAQNITHLIRSVQEAVVANNATASTVGFIAKGPSRTYPLVLYVGVTYTGNSPYRADIPAVASRSLEPVQKMFKLAQMGVSGGTRMFVNAVYRDTYPIHYIYGFSSEGFSYFLTVQMKSPTVTQYISKLVRICQNDPDYYSYTEIPVDCTGVSGQNQIQGNESSGGAPETAIHYNIARAAYLGHAGGELSGQLGITAQDEVLYIAFSKSDPPETISPGPHSALCVYTLRNIQHRFVQNIKKCFSGEGERGLAFISPSQACLHTKLTIDDNFCGIDVNTPLGGDQPVSSVPVITWHDGSRKSYPTAVAATPAGDSTVVFVGTADGHLKKACLNNLVVLESPESGLEYASLAIDAGSALRSDMVFDQEKSPEHILVITRSKLSKVKVQECELYGSCEECLGARDPYCGWCSINNKCTGRSACQDRMQYWIPYGRGRCTSISSVNPKQLQRTTARRLSLEIENLPELKGPFVCAFTAQGKTLETNATREGGGSGNGEVHRGKTTISCATPRTDLLPPILPGQHHFTSWLAVRTEAGSDVVGTNFTFFDCNTYASCTECVSSPFPCDWCVDGHRCTHDTAENCRNDVLVTGLNRIGPSIRSGPGFCPRINASDTGSSQLLVSSGTKKGIRVRVDNIAQFIVQTRFVCQFNIEGRVRSVNAQLLGDIIYCDELKFDYNAAFPNVSASFAVIWGSSKPLDNPDNIHVLIYRCREMADNCGLCLALDEKYNCGWCQSSSRCEIQLQCDKGKGAWLDRDATCPNPNVTDFYPHYGPWEGGTNITIVGVNLGKNFQDIHGGITVGGIPCDPFADSYIKTQQVTCKLDSPGTKVFRKGPVVVKVADYRGESTRSYEFVDPSVEGISPSRGPLSGGTEVSIYGSYMDAGSHVSAFLGDLPCHIVSKSREEVRCKTSSSLELKKAPVRVRFDDGERKDGTYQYVQDPKVIGVHSGPMSQVKIPRGIPSGGIGITVIGEGLDAIQKPLFYVWHNGQRFSRPCEVESAQMMRCRSPWIRIGSMEELEDGEEGHLDGDRPLELDFGFIMDNVTTVQNLSSNRDMDHFLLYPDPVYQEFPEDIKYYKSDYLTINGANLDRACQESDVKVWIGNEECKVTSLSRNQLTCKPPPQQPPPLDQSHSLPQVVVIVGGNLTYRLGSLSYSSGTTLAPPLPQGALVGLAVGGVILILIVIGIIIMYRRKSSESARVLRSMQEQMDVLELKVAAECKEAFAELQTEITDLTSDLTCGGIPFLDYRSYAMKILFPNMEDHAVVRLRGELPDVETREKGLRLFGQLLMNKIFLLLFIRALESNRYFSMRDRVNVASLIMVTLQGKMEYCTDVLKTLLAELIERCMDGRSHPKLLLRRTESVAEKMLSAWFTFLLYKFLRECAGEPLFLLYRAMKQQIDKGPVDIVTAEARYSLSEEKLIRQTVEFNTMTVYVSMSPQTLYVAGGLEPMHDNMEVQVRVLDCDTISQVKDKALDSIYKSTPYSQRPAKEDLDLEWRTGTSGRLILYDEDSTSKVENSWKRLNTLFHYRVPDGAFLTLIPKQSSIYNLASTLQLETLKSHKYETLNLPLGKMPSPPMSRATSPLNNESPDGLGIGMGTSSSSGGNPHLRTWHLVRHSEQDKEGNDRGNKMVSEIYLTRLLATKITLQKYVDDLFETIFSIAHRGSALPLAIKYLFDFLDDQALQHGLTDPEIVHTWKSNSLPLRFWVNLIKNPQFVFDIQKSHTVDSCLSVVAQTFMDSCSTSDHRLGKDSPSSKLLYAKDIPVYRDWVERYYADIATMPAISDQDMSAMLAEESRMHSSEFNTNAAIHELYAYAFKYSDQLRYALEEDEFSQRQRLAHRLDQVHQLMTGDAEA